MASETSSFIHAMRSFSASFTRRRGGSTVEDHRLLLCGPKEITKTFQETFAANFVNQAASLECLNIGRLQGFAAGWSRLSVSMNDAFILVFYTDDEDCFQAISSFRDVIIASKGENVPLLVVGYNRATSAPRIMGPETADCLMTIEWGVGYAEASAARPEDLKQVFWELFKIIRQKHEQTLERRMTSL